MKNRFVDFTLENITNNKKLILINLIIIGFFSLNLCQKEFIDTIIFVFQFYQVIIFCILPLFTITTNSLINFYDKTNMMIIRFGNKISYLKNLIYTILLHNTIIYFYILMTVIISLNVFGNFIYSFTNLDKLIYVVLKLYILIQIYSIFYALFFKTFNEKIIFFLSFVFIMSIIFCSSYDIPFYLGYHFVNDVNLSSFIIFVIINIFLIYSLFKYSIKRMDRIGE